MYASNGFNFSIFVHQRRWFDGSISPYTASQCSKGSSGVVRATGRPRMLSRRAM